MSAVAELNYGDMKDQIAEETGNETSEAKARIGRIINTFYLSLCGKRDWKWLYGTDTFAATANTQEYSGVTIIDNLTVVDKILHLYYDSGGTRTQMYELPLAEFDRLATPGATGDPYCYIYAGKDTSGYLIVKLRYVPTEAMTIYYRYKRIIAALSADADVPLMPLVHRPVLMNFAAMKIYKKQGDQGNFQTSQQMYIEGLASLLGDGSANKLKAVRLHASIMGDMPTKYPANWGNLRDYYPA